MSHFGDRNFELEVSLGKITGYADVNKFGEALDCDSGVDTDIWDGADGVTSTDVWVAPTTARIHDLVSASVNDDGSPVGTGMRTIRVFGLTGWGTAEVSEDIILNGTTNVPTVNSYVIIHRMVGLTFGSLGGNAGIITATAQTDTTITAAIQVGEGQTLMAIYGVPSTQKIAILRSVYTVLKIGGGASAKADGTLLVKENADQADAAFVTKERFQFVDGAPYVRDIHPPVVFNGPCIVKMQVNSNTANTVATALFDAYVVDN